MNVWLSFQNAHNRGNTQEIKTDETSYISLVDKHFNLYFNMVELQII